MKTFKGNINGKEYTDVKEFEVALSKLEPNQVRNINYNYEETNDDSQRCVQLNNQTEQQRKQASAIAAFVKDKPRLQRFLGDVFGADFHCHTFVGGSQLKPETQPTPPFPQGNPVPPTEEVHIPELPSIDVEDFDSEMKKWIVEIEKIIKQHPESRTPITLILKKYYDDIEGTKMMNQHAIMENNQKIKQIQNDLDEIQVTWNHLPLQHSNIEDKLEMTKSIISNMESLKKSMERYMDKVNELTRDDYVLRTRLEYVFNLYNKIVGIPGGDVLPADDMPELPNQDDDDLADKLVKYWEANVDRYKSLSFDKQKTFINRIKTILEVLNHKKIDLSKTLETKFARIDAINEEMKKMYERWNQLPFDNTKQGVEKTEEIDKMQQNYDEMRKNIANINEEIKILNNKISIVQNNIETVSNIRNHFYAF